MKKGFVKVNGTQLYYERVGHGETVVLIHGFTLDIRMWEKQVTEFSTFFDVIAYDLRGFGKSDLPKEDEAYSHVNDLLALFDYLDVNKAHVVGLSKGGRIALDFALTYPDRVNKLVLADAFLGGYKTSQEYKESLEVIWKAGRENGIAYAKKVWLAHHFFKSVDDKLDIKKLLTEIVSDYSGWHFTHRYPEQSIHPSAAKRLHEINVPTKVLVGELDIDDFQKMSSLLAKEIPRAQFQIIENAGHMSNMEQPGSFNRAVLTFLK